MLPFHVGRQSFLVVFDFDHTIVDVNTDEAIPTHLGLHDKQRRLIKEGKLQWTKLMDTLLAPFSRAQLAAAAQEAVPVTDDIKEVFRFLHAQQTQYLDTCAKDGRSEVPPFMEVNIASDANLLFIESILDKQLHFARSSISQIHSNPYYDVTPEDPRRGLDTCFPTTSQDGGPLPAVNHNTDDEAARDAAYNANDATLPTGPFVRRSRVCWYEPQGHQCDNCRGRGKPNMCKSKIIHKILHTSKLIDPTIIFVGDGANDYCPILNVLRPRDYMFCRRGFPLHNILCGGRNAPNGGAAAASPTAHIGGACHIGLWSDHADLLRLFQSVVAADAGRNERRQLLPVLSRFGDLSPREFRTDSILRRVVQICGRTLEDNLRGDPPATAAAAELVRLMVASVVNNERVPLLPSQRAQVPAWLSNFAYVPQMPPVTPQQREGLANANAKKIMQLLGCSDAEIARHYGGGEGGEASASAVPYPFPRWGQLPWLHGEIYMYQVFLQYSLITDAGLAAVAANADNAADSPNPVNLCTPYAATVPVHCTNVSFENHPDGRNAHGIPPALGLFPPSPVPGQVTAPATLYEYLVREETRTDEGVVVQKLTAPAAYARDWEADGVYDVMRYADLLAPTNRSGAHKESVLPRPVAELFATPYYDVYRAEKAGLIDNFLDVKMVPMLACRPWEADESFVGTLLRWQLWGNGLDLSMFTMDQLAANVGAAAAAGGSDGEGGGDSGAGSGADARLRHLREEETRTVMASEANLVGNEAAALEAFFHEHLRRLAAGGADDTLPHIDIVMDNCGVEALSDLILGLWYVRRAAHALAAAGREAAPKVTYHVKPMAYYVSDVTPRDFDAMLTAFEASYARGAADPKTGAAVPETLRATRQAVLEPFVAAARASFAAGHIAIAADAAWVAPCEYRELPPRVLNTYFFTHRVLSEEEARAGAAAAVNAGHDLAVNKPEAAAKTALVIFKGDLNYRRLLGDRYWNDSDFCTTVPRDDVLAAARADRADTEAAAAAATAVAAAAEAGDAEGYARAVLPSLLADTPSDPARQLTGFADIMRAYWPVADVPVASIRTMKSEGCTGVPVDVKEALDQQLGVGWRVTGKYGEILFANQ